MIRAIAFPRPGRCLALAALLGALLLPGAAAAQQKLVVAVYAGQSSKLFREAVAVPFQQATGIPTEIFETPLPSASVARLEGQPQFNIAIIGSYDAGKLADGGKIEELDPADIPNLAKVPEIYWPRSGTGKLIGVPIYFSVYGIAFNNELAKASDFQSWNNLLDRKWKGQISISRPPFVAAYDLTLFAKLAGGDERNVEPGLKMVDALARNVLSLYTSMGSLQSQLGRGEVIAAPFYSTQVAIAKRNGVKNIDLVLPREGGLLLSYMLVVPKGAADPKGTRQLLNAMIEPSYQLRLSEGSGVWPMNSDTRLPPELEKELGGSLEEMRARNYSPDWYVVSSKHAERTRVIEAVLEKAR